MARIEWVEGRLREWGEWVRAEGRPAVGYPAKSCLHPDWGIPSKGSAPVFKVEIGGRGGRTHFHVLALSQTLQMTLLLHYVKNQQVIEVAKLMACAAATVDQRIWRVHAVLAHQL